ncbi:hypothetical protein Jiend_20320 [Micromonospora endophytica]|uniref:DUF998 domain-containing protein n=1 Tax=Micromonospora endophytica TaxID=515350 RepID=UPI001BB3B8DD|nr:DUF998 domain-containing protein [Micromonospora endophytica]BCJ58610.1 hypothetical protein Jiend_20320 [Micromonospora endophytica]
MPATRVNGVLALGGIALAALLAVVGHAGVTDLDPLRLTVSDYAVSDSGGMIHVAMLLLAAASAVLVPAVRRLGPPDSRRHTATAMLTVWASGLLVSGLVPTNPPGTTMDTAAYVHRYASVVAFLALPVAGWLLAARLPAGARRWLRILTVASLVLAAAMAWSAYPGDRALYGLIERALILTEVTLLTLLTLSLSLSPPSQPPTPTPPRSRSCSSGAPRKPLITTNRPPQLHDRRGGGGGGGGVGVGLFEFVEH